MSERAEKREGGDIFIYEGVRMACRYESDLPLRDFITPAHA